MVAGLPCSARGPPYRRQPPGWPSFSASAAFSSCARRLRSPWSPGCCARPRSESARRAGVMASTTLTTRPPVGTS